MIRGIIFDLDGVVLDSLAIWQDLGERYLLENGMKAEPGLRSTLFSMSMEQGAEYLQREYLKDKSAEDILREIGDMIRRFYLDEVMLKPGVKELLQYCRAKELPVIAATSSMREHVTGALKRCGVLECFADIFTTTEIGKSKHEPLIYQIGAGRLGTKPAQTLVLEDSLYALETALAAGFRIMGVYDAFGDENQALIERIGEAYIKDLREVIPYLSDEEV